MVESKLKELLVRKQKAEELPKEELKKYFVEYMNIVTDIERISGNELDIVSIVMILSTGLKYLYKESKNDYDNYIYLTLLNACEQSKEVKDLLYKIQAVRKKIDNEE